MQMERLGGKARGIMHIASHTGSVRDEVDVHGDSKMNVAAKDKKKRAKEGIVQQVKIHQNLFTHSGLTPCFWVQVGY